MDTPLIETQEDEEIILINNNNSSNYRKEQVLEEVKKQIWLAGPLVSVSVLQYSLQLISLMYVGHLDDLALSGASVANSFAVVTGFSLLLGMASALDTLCGQSYGAQQYHMLGIHMQRAMLILSCISIPLAVIWANTYIILVTLGQDPAISAQAQIYSLFMIPSLFAYALLQCLVKFLQTQNDVFPMVISAGITTIIHLFVCWVLVFKSGLGVGGAGLANSISYWVNVFLLVAYVKFSPSCDKTWGGFSKEAFCDILSFVQLAIPSAVMVCLESWSFELMVLMSGLLPNPELQTSVLSICLNTAATVWMIPYGLSNSVSTRVSNELGAGNPRTARMAVCVVVVMAITEGIFVGMVLIFIRNIWGYAYSDDTKVAKYVAAMMPILAISNFLDGLQCVLSGSVRGCGKQKIGALINLGSYYLVGIPSAIFLAFVLHLDCKGLWLGIICGLFVQVVSLFTITICTDWNKEAKKATESVLDSTITNDSVSSN